MTGPATSSPRAARQARLQALASVRVTGTLTDDADLCSGVGREPHAFLILRIEQPRGLPYEARIDLGTDVADHMAAEADLPYLRRGALVSVAGAGLQPRTDHGHAVLMVQRAHGLVIPLGDPIDNPSTEGVPHAD